jgi:hypothetical protein
MLPFLTGLLGDQDKYVRDKTVELIGKLATHGECQLKNRCGMVNLDYRAEFRGAITSMMP